MQQLLGEWRRPDASQVVPGDLVQFSTGDLVPADGCVLTAHNFFVNHALLTDATSLPPPVVPACWVSRPRSLFAKPPATAFEIGLRRFFTLLLHFTVQLRSKRRGRHF